MSHILVYSQDDALFAQIAASLPTNISIADFTGLADLCAALREAPASLLILDVPPSGAEGEVELDELAPLTSDLPVLLLARDADVSAATLRALVRMVPRSVLTLPLKETELRTTVFRLLRDGRGGAGPYAPPTKVPLAEANRRLNARLQDLNVINTVGKSVTGSLDAREILDRVVVAAVNLTHADEGFIILQEDDRLFVRVVKRRDDRFIDHRYQETFDSVAWQVVRSGRPAMRQRDTEIATGLVARALLYVPLKAPGAEPTGVLGVVNRENSEAFSEEKLFALSTLADFAAIALQNARLVAALETECTRLSGILEQATEAIIVTDLRDRLWVWSETAARLFDIDSQAQGQALPDVIDNQEIVTLFAQAASEHEMPSAEVKLDDDRVYNAQVSTIEGVGYLVVMQDITHLKELDRLKSEFVATVSHDLRTPLTTVQSYIELLARVGPLNEEQAGFVDHALSSLSHITALISDLLDIGRVEAGYDLEMRPLRLDDLIRTTVDATQSHARHESVSLDLDLPGEPLWVLGNQRRLRQVLENLIGNAIKYNQPEGWIRVAARRDRDHVVVQVSDSGIGIPADEEAKIFDRFYRVQSPETENVLGTGLGLSIVKSVVEKHKGRIWVESAPGEGSTFTFVLPTLEDAD